MSRLFSIFFAATLAASAPALAQPLRITVPGGTVRPDPNLQRHYLFGFDNDPTARATLWNDYRTPHRLGEPFDGARAALDAEAIAHPPIRFRQQWNADLAATQIRTGDSFAGHWLRCQQAFPGYDLVTNTYWAPGGIPRPCRL
jgi:hypothetical protein